VISVEITATTLVTLAKQQGENRALWIGGPFPEFRTPTDTPGADVFLFVCVYGFEVLTHEVVGKEIEENARDQFDRGRSGGVI
jgi:hypothetical protein